MKWLLAFLLGVMFGILGIEGYEYVMISTTRLAVIHKSEIKTKPLEKYAIENLAGRQYDSKIVLSSSMQETVSDTVKYDVRNFYFDSDGKRVTGLAHIPRGDGPFPVIVQFRGYAEPENYESGYGTKHSAEMFAVNGFISLAPDFLGYSESSSPSANIWEARFETYTTAANLLAAVEKWEKSNGKIGVWGHSNGGQIALTVLEISGTDYPTVLWAPVTAGFPYSVLYFMDDNSQKDMELRQKLADFEMEYDYRLFNPLGFLDRVRAKILLQQGSDDQSVPQKWNDKFVGLMKKLDNDVAYVAYPGADHNLTPFWGRAVLEDIAFYRQEMSK